MGKSVVTENPKRGIAENFGRIQRRGALKFTWKMKTWEDRQSEKKKLLGEITAMKQHSKGTSAKFHLV